MLDDGAVLYLNGKEIWRNRVSGSAPAYSALADVNVGDAVYEGPFEIQVDNLNSGVNTLAAEVHQSAAASSDVVFGLTLEHLSMSSASQGELALNEVQASRGTPRTAGQPTSDFIEIANTSDRTLSLDGFALTDDVLNPSRFRFPAGTQIAPKGRLVIWCDNETNAPGLHSEFELNDGGQTVLLLAPSPTGFTVADSVQFGAQIPDHSIGRAAHGSGEWQLNEPTPAAANRLAPTAPLSSVVLNEWMASPESGDDWFELHNRSELPVALGGHFLTGDLSNPAQSPITALTFIEARGHLSFTADNNPDAGPDHTSFRLSASGDVIGLFSSSGGRVDSVTFGPQRAGVSQGRLPDGAAAIVSFPLSATKGRPNFLPLNDVVINEVLSHSDPPLEDSVELFNASTVAVEVGGWFLSDDPRTPKKYRLPAGTRLPPSGFLVLFESQFNADTNAPTSFALNSSRGDQIILSAADASGNLTGYRAEAEFGPAFNGVSFGRLTTSTGIDFTALSQTTFGSEPAATLAGFRTGRGAPNAAPRLSPVQISEIMYHPPDAVSGTNRTDDTVHEFVELRNTSPLEQPLFDPAYPANTWRVRGGVEMELPPGLRLAPGGHLLLVNFNPATNAAALASFQSRYAVPANVTLLGPYRGKLSNAEDRVDLLKPDGPALAGPDVGYVPFVLVDRVRYGDQLPWPIEADGGGASLQRRGDRLYGNDAANWMAGAPSPGRGAPLSQGVGPTVRRPSLSENIVQIQYEAQAGKTHQLEYRDALESGVWSKLGDPHKPATPGGVVFRDSPPASLKHRYYRLSVF